jgi:hypothetical protein
MIQVSRNTEVLMESSLLSVEIVLHKDLSYISFALHLLWACFVPIRFYFKTVVIAYHTAWLYPTCNEPVSSAEDTPKDERRPLHLNSISAVSSGVRILSNVSQKPKVQSKAVVVHFLTIAWVSDCTGAPCDVATHVVTTKRVVLSSKKSIDALKWSDRMSWEKFTDAVIWQRTYTLHTKLSCLIPGQISATASWLRTVRGRCSLSRAASCAVVFIAPLSDITASKWGWCSALWGRRRETRGLPPSTRTINNQHQSAKL